METEEYSYSFVQQYTKWTKEDIVWESGPCFLFDTAGHIVKTCVCTTINGVLSVIADNTQLGAIINSSAYAVTEASYIRYKTETSTYAVTFPLSIQIMCILLGQDSVVVIWLKSDDHIHCTAIGSDGLRCLDADVTRLYKSRLQTLRDVCVTTDFENTTIQLNNIKIQGTAAEDGYVIIEKADTQTDTLQLTERIKL